MNHFIQSMKPYMLGGTPLTPHLYEGIPPVKQAISTYLYEGIPPVKQAISPSLLGKAPLKIEVAAPILAAPILAAAPIKKARLIPKGDNLIWNNKKGGTVIAPPDTLFWCFFIFLKGYEEYELHKSDAFAVEKKIKIETVEKLKSIKEKLKELKLKRTELEDELVNQPKITIKGLYALCLVHNISITYISGRKYYEICPDLINPVKKGIIEANKSGEASINDDLLFLENVRKDYWFIDNIQKPLKAPSAYTIKELQDISERLNIDIMHMQSKLKTKKVLYEEILQHI